MLTEAVLEPLQSKNIVLIITGLQTDSLDVAITAIILLILCDQLSGTDIDFRGDLR